MTVGRTLTTWGDHNINDDDPFASAFLSDSGIVGTHEAQPVEVDRPGTFPVHAYAQPSSETFTIEVSIIGSVTFADAWKDLQAWFDPALGRQYLAATDADNNAQRLLCLPVRLEIAGGEAGTAGNVITVTLHAADPRWEDVDAETDSEDVGAGGGEVMSWTLTNDGNTRTPMQIAITSSAAKDPGDSWPTRRRVLIANRAPKALDDPLAKAYPVLLCDLSALDAPITAGNDIRVVLNDEFIPFWLEGNLLWTNLAFPPMKSATLAANINDSVTSLSVDNFQGFEHNRWPKDGGFFFLDDEVIQYTARDTDEMTIVRGAMGSTPASHTAGATLYWIRYPYLSLLYGFTDADAPPAYADTKPVIDLANSTNVEQQWPDTFFATERQARAFQRRFSDQGVGSQHIRQYDDGTSLVYENNQAVAGKPNLNDAVIEFPVSAVGPFEADEDVELTMLLRGYAADAEGYESKLIDQAFSDGPLTAQSFAVPNVVSRLRLVGSVGVVVGSFDLDDEYALAAPDTPGTADPDHPEIEILEQMQDNAVRFTLVQQTKATGIWAAVGKSSGATGDLTIYIVRDGGGGPAVDIVNIGLGGTKSSPEAVIALTIANADLPTDSAPLRFYPFDSATIIDAGTYWQSFTRAFGDTGDFLIGTGVGNFVSHKFGFTMPETTCIAFGISSDETEPQDDAPLDNGDTIEVANLIAPLDSTQAPKIWVGDEEAIDFIDGRLTNDDTTDYLDLFFLNPIGNTLTVDTDAHTATDAETGLSVPWAARPSNPERFMDLQASDNDISLTEDGVTGRTVVTTWRARRL